MHTPHFACPFVLFRLAIPLSILLSFMASDYPIAIFKLYLWFPHSHCTNEKR